MKNVVISCVAAVCLAACGGGAPSRPTPTPPATPAPPPPPPAASAACGALAVTTSPSLAIVNGAECSAANSPVVLLNMRHSLGFGLGACSGTIITPRAILTAAHCLDEEVGTVRVWLGAGEEIVAESFAFHPSYTQSNGLDVGVVIMAQDLPRTPVPLLTSRDASRGEAAVIAGWGRDQQSVGATLRAGATTISSVSALFLETEFSSTASSICSGDSGGPILISQGGRWAIAGISSAASVATCNAGTNFYVSVRNSSISSFILSRVPGAGGI
jgi:secreted trypsin-like serine protease